MNKETKQDKIMERFIANAKKETLEEAAEKRYPFEDGFQVMDIDISEMLQLAFINGAKWQQEQDAKEIQLLREEISYLKRNKL